MDALPAIIFYVILISAVFTIWYVGRNRNHRRMDKLHSEYNLLLKRLEDDPDSQATQQDIISKAKEIGTHRIADHLYQSALKLLSPGCDRSRRIFTLEVGRLAVSKGRESGVPTLYDEAAINNDIAVRC